jgi:hypothetical protein
MSDKTDPAGLAFAPPYDPSDDLDPSAVHAVPPTKGFDPSVLEFYQQQAARRTMVARVVLLVAIVGMLGVNIYLSQRNYEALLINVDQARSAQLELVEVTWARMDRLEGQIAALETDGAPADGN